MVTLSELVCYADRLLEVPGLRDYCPNGLQVEGRAEVGRLVSGVTASQAFLDRALALEPDAVLVHHGYFWNGEPPQITGLRARRIGTLLLSRVSLVAYHLPLDLHPELGNNAALGRILGLASARPAEAAGMAGLVWHGELPAPMTPGQLNCWIATRLGRPPVHAGGGPGVIRRLAWCTGAGQRFIGEAARLGVDAYLSGEISEPTTHEARELGVHYFACGHHATERGGVQTLGAHLAQRFGLEHRFLDVENPA